MTAESEGAWRTNSGGKNNTRQGLPQTGIDVAVRVVDATSGGEWRHLVFHKDYVIKESNTKTSNSPLDPYTKMLILRPRSNVLTASDAPATRPTTRGKVSSVASKCKTMEKSLNPVLESAEFAYKVRRGILRGVPSLFIMITIKTGHRPRADQ